MADKRICIVGSTSFPLDAQIGAQIVEIIRDLAPEAILTRGASGLDDFVQRVAVLIGIPVVVFPTGVHESNWHRDIAMVEQADSVLGFLSPDSLGMEKMSGTQHVLEKGLDQKKPTKAYTVVGSQLVWAGEDN